MADITRLQIEKYYSKATVYKGVVFLAGQVPRQCDADFKAQARDVLEQIDELLGEAGADKHRILSSQIFLADIADYDAFNEVWHEWVSPQNPPPRATLEAKLANPGWKLEIVLTAAVY